jgi:methanogenic corrinoid protein MtbC1
MANARQSGQRLSRAPGSHFVSTPVLSRNPPVEPVPASAAPLDPAGVADVERATGIPRATLRMWERRYGFPCPQRDARGERCYDDAQIAKLRLIATLTSRGHRPGRLIGMPADQLQALLPGGANGKDGMRHGHEPLVQLMRQLDAGALTGWLLQQLAATGLERFVQEVLPGTNALVGEAWACGELQVHEEHLYTECVQQVLRIAMAALPAAPDGAGPRVLLATLPREPHGLGLLGVQALLQLERCTCLPLGLNLPVVNIVEAAQAWNPDVVALSFSQAYPARELTTQLAQLQERLAPHVEIWVGGRSAALPRLAQSGTRLRYQPDLPGLKSAVAELRSRAGAR